MNTSRSTKIQTKATLLTDSVSVGTSMVQELNEVVASDDTGGDNIGEGHGGGLVPSSSKSKSVL